MSAVPHRREEGEGSTRRGGLGPAADGALNLVVKEPGRFFALCLDTFRALFKFPFQWREFIQQAWFIVGVTVIPTALVAIPFGAILALQVGGLIRQFGAQSFT